MKSPCINCHVEDPTGSKVWLNGKYFRHSTNSWVPKYWCRICGNQYTQAIFEDDYRQKKRQFNRMVVSLLAHEHSQRETARTLGLNFKTVVRKFKAAAFAAEHEFKRANEDNARAEVVEFDDMETFEHTKHKPLSITIAVEKVTRRILMLEVSIMPSRGRVAKKAREKYGKRPDLRQKMRKVMFERLQGIVAPKAEFRSDQNPWYPFLVKKYFPGSLHRTYKGKRGCVTGQGELKEGKFDPLFAINHTCAMIRANVNRLIRKTWCTTKSAERLKAHLLLYANEHNKRLVEMAKKKAARSKPKAA